jgi:Domain of unknown function (DUF4268)
MTPIGKLESIDLRVAWQNEATGFTPWLAMEENLALLSETLDLQLELEKAEKDVGPYSADIVCRDIQTDRIVLIENQLEKTDHGHLGQLFTYAAGVDAVILIWIAKKFTEEHRAAVDWLNKISGPDFHFFALEVELWKIGDSPPAPKFNVVCKPNDWSKTLKTRLDDEGQTEHQLLRFRFWTAFKEWAEGHTSLHLHSPSDSHWLNMSAGRSGMQFAAIISKWDSFRNKYSPEIRAELVLTSDKAKKQFASLQLREDEFQKHFDIPLHWDNPETAKRARVFVQANLDFMDEKKWSECNEWLARYLTELQRVFGPVLHDI